MKTALVFLACLTACCVAGEQKPAKSERLKVVSTCPVLNVYGHGGILVSASLVTDSETGREWLIVSGAADTHVHVTEIK